MDSKKSNGFMFFIHKYWETKEFNLGFNICKDVWDNVWEEDHRYCISIMLGFIGFTIGYELTR